MKPVRFYLILLFVAVLGIGLYLVLKQYNDDLDANSALNNQKITSEVPAKTATPAATAATK